MQPKKTVIRKLTPKLSRVLGAVEINIEIDSVVRKIEFKADGDIEQEVILSMDFCKDFDFEMNLGQGIWKVWGGAWHSFATHEEGSAATTYAECADISALDETQKERVERLVAEILSKQSEESGVTNLTENHIELTGSIPIRHRLRRMSPKMSRTIARYGGLRVCAIRWVDSRVGRIKCSNGILK